MDGWTDDGCSVVTIGELKTQTLCGTHNSNMTIRVFELTTVNYLNY